MHRKIGSKRFVCKADPRSLPERFYSRKSEISLGNLPFKKIHKVLEQLLGSYALSNAT
jgi:hypothetical protein